MGVSLLPDTLHHLLEDPRIDNFLLFGSASRVEDLPDPDHPLVLPASVTIFHGLYQLRQAVPTVEHPLFAWLRVVLLFLMLTESIGDFEVWHPVR